MIKPNCPSCQPRRMFPQPPMGGTDSDPVERLPVCPLCFKDIDIIYTCKTVHLRYKDGKWGEIQVDHHFSPFCPYCYQEFGPEDLDKLGIPENIR